MWIQKSSNNRDEELIKLTTTVIVFFILFPLQSLMLVLYKVPGRGRTALSSSNLFEIYSKQIALWMNR